MNNSSVDQSNEVSPLLGPWFLYPVATSYILIAAVAVIGNLLVCFAILANKKLRSKPTNLFLLSLAVSDFLTSVIAMPFDIESLILQGGWKHGAVMCLAFLTAYHRFPQQAIQIHVRENIYFGQTPQFKSVASIHSLAEYRFV